MEVWGSKETNHGVKRVRVLTEYEYSTIPKKKWHRDVHGAKEMQLELSQQLFNFDDAKGGLRNIGELVMLFLV